MLAPNRHWVSSGTNWGVVFRVASDSFSDKTWITPSRRKLTEYDEQNARGDDVFLI